MKAAWEWRGLELPAAALPTPEIIAKRITRHTVIHFVITRKGGSQVSLLAGGET
jgi:hypothetical protein